MSSTWARAEIAARRGARAVLGAAGSGPVSAAGLALAACSVLAAEAWDRLAPGAAADAFGTSPARWAVAALVLANGLAGLVRALPARFDAQDRLHLDLDLRSAGRSLVRAGEVLLGLALAVSLLARDGFDVRLSQGERYAAAPEQLVGAAAPRRFPRGPSHEPFTIGEVTPGGGGDGSAAPSVVVRTEDGAVRRASRAWPAWLGGGRSLSPTAWGWSVRWELLDPGGAAVEGAFAKLELLPAGRVDVLRLPGTGARAYVSLAAEQPPPQSVGRALRARVYRGRLLLADRVLLPGEPVAFEGWTLRFPEAARWAQFRMIDDRGVPVALGAALAAALGALLLAAARVRGAGDRRPAAPPSRPASPP